MLDGESGTSTLPAYLTKWYAGLGMHPGEGFFEQALRDGRCLVLLDGLDEVATRSDVVVFHAASKGTDEGLVTAGGRVLGVTGLGDSLPAAMDAAYGAVERIGFEGAQWRRDIGRRAAGRQ